MVVSEVPPQAIGQNLLQVVVLRASGEEKGLSCNRGQFAWFFALGSLQGDYFLEVKLPHTMSDGFVFVELETIRHGRKRVETVDSQWLRFVGSSSLIKINMFWKIQTKPILLQYVTFVFR